jgi:Heparinase II/III N-terminus/Heparinase II/III-like protein
MRNPGLSSRQFVRDQVLFRETLFSGEDLTCFNEGTIEEDGFRLIGSGRLSFIVQPSDPDLSRFNSLSLEIINRSSTALLVGARLSHIYLEDSPGPAHFSLSGGREELPVGIAAELKFPAECFCTYGIPHGWEQVREIEFMFCREKNYSGSDNIDLTVRSVHGELRKIPEGPRLTVEGLARLLKQSSSAEPGSFPDFSASQPHLTRPAAELRLLVPPPHPYPKESADEILRGRIMGQNLGRDIQWDANPLGFPEWTHFLNRCHFMRELVLAFVRTRESQYAAELDRLISRWIRQNPVPVGSNGGAGPAWETLSAAWRLREWLFVTEHAWQSEAFSESTKTEMLRSIWEHATSLMDHKGHPNNWIIVESASLALAGLAFPEFKDSGLWVNTGIGCLQAEFSRQFFGDGVHFEISPLYHAICLHAMLEVKLAAKARGVLLPDEFGAPLEHCTDYLAALCRPDFTWPSLNDSGPATQDYTTLVLLAGEVFQRPDLIWIGSKGDRYEPPAAGSRTFSDAGIVVMRSDFTSDANYLVFRSGPAGAAHIHADVLSLDVAALGVSRLVDPGITTYAPDRLTEHYRSAAAHNTILVNAKGRDLSRMGFSDKTGLALEDVSYRVEDGVEIASGICRGPWANGEDIILLRTVYFVRGSYWIIQDKARGNGEHEITVCWQFAPGRVEMDLETFGARFIDLRGPSFEIIPLPGASRPEIEVFTGSFRPSRGWVSVDGSDMPATSCAYNFSAKLPLTLVWFLIPFSSGPTCGVQAKRLNNAGGSMTIEIVLPDGHVDLINL